MAETVNEETGEITETPDDDAPITEEQVQEAEQEDSPPEPEPDVIEDAQAKFDERKAEAGRKRIDRAVSSMVKTLNEVLADEAQFLQACPRCADDFPGLIWDPTVKQVLPATRAAVMISMGEGAPVDLERARDAEQCPDCKGYGKVNTGSKVLGQDKLVCNNCKGRGWVGERASRTPEPVLTLNGNPDGELQLARDPDTEPDSWGRMPDDPNYWVLPGHER